MIHTQYTGWEVAYLCGCEMPGMAEKRVYCVCCLVCVWLAVFGLPCTLTDVLLCVFVFVVGALAELRQMTKMKSTR